ILRGKTLMADEAVASIESGCSITTTLLAKDTSHRTVFPVFSAGGGFGMSEMQGGGDILMVDDPRLGLTDSGTPGRPGEPPDVSLLSQGYQYLTEQRYDQMEPALEVIRDNIVALGLPLRSIEVEYGPSQCEFVFQPTVVLTPADTMVLFRTAVKQICNRHGYHATFMCRPRIPNVMSSGWHLHQSLAARDSGSNAFMTSDPDGLSKLG